MSLTGGGWAPPKGDGTGEELLSPISVPAPVLGAAPVSAGGAAACPLAALVARLLTGGTRSDWFCCPPVCAAARRTPRSLAALGIVSSDWLGWRRVRSSRLGREVKMAAAAALAADEAGTGGLGCSVFVRCLPALRPRSPGSWAGAERCPRRAGARPARRPVLCDYRRGAGTAAMVENDRDVPRCAALPGHR